MMSSMSLQAGAISWYRGSRSSMASPRTKPTGSYLTGRSASWNRSRPNSCAGSTREWHAEIEAEHGERVVVAVARHVDRVELHASEVISDDRHWRNERSAPVVGL